jgi:hypothetical protein
MPGRERFERPSAWIEDGELFYCLACRRELAAEAGLIGAAPGAAAQDRAKLRAAAVVEFEVRRDPDRSNVEIARAARSSVNAVLKARQRLGVAPAR